MKAKKIALIGTYPPRKCGIATFTRDLNNGINQNGLSTRVLAINDGYDKYFYPAEVGFEIEQNDIASYIGSANYLNTNGFDAVLLQHEFGIFGGKDGRHVIQLLKRLRMPVFTTLHTILDEPSDGQREVINEISQYTYKFVSMSKIGVNILKNVYDIPDNRVHHIHHGVHKMEIVNSKTIKKKLAVQNKTVILTFGLISRNKSIEVVINALPEIVQKYPDVVYIVLGATHPHVVKHDGEAYRHSLIRLVNKLNLQKHVIFIDRFISNEELFEYLQACDIYVIPYSGEKQITSGTLIYAMNAGKPIISTPFWYAREMLAENRGLFFDFGNSQQLSLILKDLLKNKEKRDLLAQNALNLAKECYWPNIGKAYINMINKDIGKIQVKVSEQYQIVEREESKFTLPPIKLTHLHVLTDDTGILQHARYNIPNRREGYCLDDNARALMVSILLQNDFQDKDTIKKMTSIYLSFIDYAYNPANGKFRNFMRYDRQWLEDEGSEDCQGRAIWALGYASVFTNDSNVFLHSNHLFDLAVNNINSLTHPQALAYAVLGLTYHVEVAKNDQRISLLGQNANRLASFFDQSITNTTWPWFQNRVTYASSRIPQALIAAGVFLNDDKMVKKGLNLLDWLIEKQFEDGIFMPIGNNGWLTPESKARFDQQPIEAHCMIDACLQAEKISQKDSYSDLALKAFAWFTGDNNLSVPMYDFSTGGCRDGLHPNGANENQGAESTLSWLISLLNISNYLRNKKMP